MHMSSIAAVDFLVETSRSGICKMGAIIPHKPIFPSRLGLSSDAWLRAFPPVRPPCHLPALSSHSPGLKVHTTQS